MRRLKYHLILIVIAQAEQVRKMDIPDYDLFSEMIVISTISWMIVGAVILIIL